MYIAHAKRPLQRLEWKSSLRICRLNPSTRLCTKTLLTATMDSSRFPLIRT